MFLFWFMKKMSPPLSRAYCILAQLTNSKVLGMLAIRDLNNWVIQELLLTDLPKNRIHK